MKLVHTLCAVLLSGMIFSGVRAQEAAAEKPAKPAKQAKTDSLDDDVLKLLADDPDVDLGKKPDPKQGEGPAAAPEKKTDAPASKIPGLDDKLIRELESDQVPDDEDPLARVGTRMRSVQQRIQRNDSGDGTQKVQEEIVADLDQVLKALKEKQKQQQQQQSSSSQKPQQGERSTPSQPKQQPGENGGDGKRNENDNPAKESTKEVGPEKPPTGPLQQIPDLLRDSATWGHLPEHQRQVLIQASKLQFLSEYRQMIEDYYTRLAQPNRE